MNATYDPLLAEEVPSRFAIRARQYVPDPGTVLVVHRAGRLPEAFAPEGGRLTAGEIMWGQVRKIYTVDVSEHPLGWECWLPSSEDSFDFHARLLLTCAVVDPIAVVQHRIRDVHSVVEPLLADEMREASRRFSLKDRAGAEGAVMSALRSRERESEGFAPAFRLTRIVAKLSLDAQIADVNRMRKLHHEFYLPIVQQGQWSLLALHLSRDPDALGDAIDAARYQDQKDVEAQLYALELFLQKGDVPKHEFERPIKQVLESFRDGLKTSAAANPLFGSKRIAAQPLAVENGATGGSEASEAPGPEPATGPDSSAHQGAGAPPKPHEGKR